MLFHEIYGCYYNAVAQILTEAVNGELTEKRMKEIIDEKAFSESFLTIIPAVKDEKWQILKKDLSTPLKKEPQMPLTLLQKQWLKAISLDPRIKLFDVDFSFLDDIKPLFTTDDYVVFDKYNNGDDFEDENYIKVFRTIFEAVKNAKKVQVHYHGSKGTYRVFKGDPYKLEYSEKDDKFRVLMRSCRGGPILRLDCIESAVVIGDAFPNNTHEVTTNTEYIIMEVTDVRNSLERVMLHFAHFKKEAERLDGNKYRVKIFYDTSDETELVIRVLSFGPFVKVTEPKSFVELIVWRLKNQKNIGFNEL